MSDLHRTYRVYYDGSSRCVVVQGTTSFGSTVKSTAYVLIWMETQDSSVTQR